MKKWTDLALRSFLCLFTIAAIFVSCADDDALWNKIHDLEARLDSLENNLNSQVAALNSLMSDGSTISSCVQNTDGSYVIELSNGTKFTAMPDSTNFSSLVSCVLVDGKNCWATSDPSGNLITLTDAAGKPIPVSASIEVKIVDGIYYLVVNGREYATGYDAEEAVQVFSSCTPLKDASGQVYAVKFKLGEGWEVTVTVDGYRGVLFKLSSINSTVVSEYFIDYGQTQTFLMDTRGVVDYVMQIPDGWRIEESVEQLTGDVYVSITAPARETVEMSAAVASGDLKVVSVVEGGKAAVTRLTLSTDPFKTYNRSSLKAVIEPYMGVQKFVYGILPVDGFDQDQLMDKINAILGSSADVPEGFVVSEVAIDKTHEETYPALTENGKYVFWAVPALYSEGNEDRPAGYYATDDMLRIYNMSPLYAKLEVGEPTLLDADIELSVVGTTQIYGGVALKTEKTIEEIVYQINNGGFDMLSGPDFLQYKGPASCFPDKEHPHYMEPDASYVVWVVPVEAGKKEYRSTDVLYKEFTTKAVTKGGSHEVTISEAKVGKSSISYTVSCDDAAMIYYAFLDTSSGNRYSASTISNETRWQQIVAASTFKAVRGSSVEAMIDGLMPETNMWLFAVAVGHDGRYGIVNFSSATTEKVSFNTSMQVKVNTIEVLSDEATFQITVTGGTPVDYLYWVGRESNLFYNEVCQKNPEKLASYMAANPESEFVTDVMKHNGPIGADGTLKVTDLAIGKEHFALVLAKDSDGNYSKFGYRKFTTESINLGADFVAEGSDKWNTTKKWIEDNIEWDDAYFESASGNGQGAAAYAFGIKIPTDLTAFIYCFGIPENVTDVTDVIAFLEAESSSSAAYPKVVYDENGEQPLLPDWYDDNGRFIQGTLLSISSFFVHGDPSRGFVTYFAADAHDDHCQVWTDGTCASYKAYQESIKQFCSIEYWKDYLIDFGNYNHEGDPNSEYSRKLQDEAKINTLAQQYCDLHKKYYKDAEPIVYVNDGSALRIINRTASGVDENGNVIDKVRLVLKDMNDNYYAPMVIDVPNLFTK